MIDTSNTNYMFLFDNLVITNVIPSLQVFVRVLLCCNHMTLMAKRKPKFFSVARLVSRWQIVNANSTYHERLVQFAFLAANTTPKGMCTSWEVQYQIGM